MIKLEKKEYLFLIILLIVLMLNFYGVFSFSYSRVNDQEAHTFQLWYLENFISKYHDIPAWTSDNFGGRPFFGVYQQGAYYLTFWMLFLFNPQTTLVISMFIAAVIFSFSFYLLSRKLFKDKVKAFLSTLILINFPYFFYLEIDPWAQYMATAFVPLTFLLYEKFKERFNLSYCCLISILVSLTLFIHQTVGAPLFGAILFFIAYDFYKTKNKKFLSLIPFLAISFIIVILVAIPILKIQNTLQFEVLKQSSVGAHYTEKIKLISFSTFFLKGNPINEYIGILAAMGILFSLLSFNKKDLDKYIILGILLLAFCFFLMGLMPDFFKEVFQWSSRLYSVLLFPLAILITEGYYTLSEKIIILIKENNILDVEKYKKALPVIVLGAMLLFTIYDYRQTKVGFNVVPITPELARFYKNVSQNPEFFRIEDQSVSAFGFTTTLSKHGVLNGAPMQEAPKYHFNFWSGVWQLLNTEQGKENFAGVYGLLSVKYLIFPQEMSIAGFDKIECSMKYCIYENKRFTPHLDFIPSVLSIPYEKPNSIGAVLQVLSTTKIPLEKVSFLETKENLGIKNLSELSSLKKPVVKYEIIEERPGRIILDIKEKPSEKVFLRISESYNPFWKAYQDGKEIKIYEGIPSTLVIPIENNGQIKIEFIFDKIKKTYLSLTFIFFIILIIVYFILKNREKKNERKASELAEKQGE
jgi:hypothetical protein